jgi:FkbM family methyltransferase
MSMPTQQLPTDPVIQEEMIALRREMALLRDELGALAKTTYEIRALVGPFGAAMPDGTMLVQTLFGNKYYIDPLDFVIAPNLITYRQWEADLSALMANAAKPNMLFVDIGANFGYFTCLMGSKIGNSGGGRVVAVEPNAAMTALLRRNIAINWSMCPVDVYDCAVSDTPGLVSFHVPRNGASNASMVPSALPAPAIDPTSIINVEARRLDDLLADGTSVDLMKIDVEGHELAALRGAERVVAQSVDIKIIMEWSLPQMQFAGYSAADLFAQFERMNLDPYLIPKDRQFESLSTSITAEALAALPYENLILMHKLV